MERSADLLMDREMGESEGGVIAVLVINENRIRNVTPVWAVWACRSQGRADGRVWLIHAQVGHSLQTC